MKFSLKMRYLMSQCLDCHQTCKDLPEGGFQEFTILQNLMEYIHETSQVHTSQ